MGFHIRFRLVLVLMLALIIVVSGCEALPGSTEISDLETRNAQLQGTIDGMGTPAATIAALAMTADRSMMLQAELSNLQGTALAAQSTLTVQQLGGGAVAPTQPAGVSGSEMVMGPTGAATPDGGGGGSGDTGVVSSSGTSFYETTLARSRDSFDCPLNATTSFDTSDTVIYSIVRVSNLRAGSTIGVRWYANGVLVEEGQCWTPNRDWEDVCAYCDLRPSGTVFEAGSWSVEMLLDGEVMSQASFQVTGSGADMGATGDQGGDTTDFGGDTTGESLGP